ncbi:uncharacterized protein BDZ99DRAFT_467777 [Mytilinidion resinicola]|uniref:Protein transport protein SEC31 n=1 Tax=Mytilinidion resinicola TaxID=574789 RepID=A0A6A6Y5H3_9PEZI|nr:uncharacterized protein BDZ99DRAFT_467777 [Mytilinidion resinicola]KAF2804056.1 hypothetical protein BDZ99DRAFT_467777 [Mytilinidion resinicola]
MVRLREITRTATFAWAPGTGPPLIVTGTRAGAVDADFSNETQLELWDLALDNSHQGVELQPVGSISVDSRFHDIAWSQPSEEYPGGIIAGALESGALDLWDAAKLRTDASNSFLGRSTKHTGAIKTLQFNTTKHNLLATAGAKGEIYIHDISDPTDLENAFRLSTSAPRADDIETLDWNKKVPHILATGSNGGFVSVWDVRQKRQNMALNLPGQKKVSAVAWDPDVPTRLVTAIPDDQSPVLLVWDLRNSNAPEKTLRGHEQGILSVSWCGQDGDLLLSCGMDNRTICWNPHTGQSLGEFPIVTNWTFQTRFNPHNPSLLATASFDGKIAVQTIQNTRQDAAQAPKAASQALDGEDFFAKVQTEPQGAAFSLPQAPKWLKRPTGVSFGFGGKLVKFGPSGDSGKSTISISIFAVDSAIGSATEEFDAALKNGDLAKICESRIGDASTEEEKADWTVIGTLISENPRKKLVDYLGFSDKKEEGAEVETKEAPQSNGTAEDGASFFDGAGADDGFLSKLASSKTTKADNPFQIYAGSESEADKGITRALLLGSFEAALDICLKENRLSDAFMIAICGGQKCIDKAQAAYFKGRADGPNYLRLLASIVGKNLWDVVHNADLKDWKEVMATLCTFADQSEFPDLCEALGDRLEESISDKSDAGSLRKDATFCYLAGSKLEKVVGNWAQELQENEAVGLEKSENDTSFSVHARSLQDFIEKVTVFRQVTNFKDSERQQPSGWKLAPLYAKYTEYADIAAAHGKLQIAEKYLDLLPDKYPAADVARNRVKQATRTAPQATQKQAPSGAAQRAQRVVPAAYQPGPIAPAQQPSNSPYTPAGVPTNVPAPAHPSQSGYPGATGGRSAYTPAGYQPQQAPQQTGYNAPSQPQYGGYQPPHPHHQPIPPPPRNFTASPSAPILPAAKNTNIPAWNDTPDFGNKPISRRGTPSVGPNIISSPFANQPNTAPPPAGFSPSYPPQRSTPPVAPPPKGPPRVSSPPYSRLQTGSRPSSSAANTYAPPQSPASFAAPPPQHQVPRGTSPYNPPPPAAPPSNRYAPTPSAQPTPSQGMAPPQRQIASPPNPYASSQYPPSPAAQAPPSQWQPPPPPAKTGPPPSGPPRGGPPGGPPSGHQKTASGDRPGTGQSQRSTPALTKYPPGDRSHIPASAQRIYQVLTNELRYVVDTGVPPDFEKYLTDAKKRLDILFDHLNNGELLKADTIEELNEITRLIAGNEYDRAMALFTDLITRKTEEGSNWMVGVKRLLQFGKNSKPDKEILKDWI